ncbi:EamA family transporter [Flagellimonas flava]|uniref:EamA-like transporter family protein n=1 Tax=Flagellimonas flava TaxID=570519 RepID=A0A1M5I8R5_9FLAO|nr:EamA family transporter [Allomuricauda flava]SHG24675.1 EamA-like transporter family protein [Allomuricauda flava]
MLHLLFSVLCTTLIFIIFKLFDVYKVQTPYAIVVNYVVAFTVGILLYGGEVNFTQLSGSSWFLGAMGMGVFFILIFNLMAKASQVAGVAVASVATKMSLVIPVVIGVILYQEKLSALQITGILLALAAVYFTSIKEKSLTISKKSLLLPILVFIGSGIIDTSMKYFEERHLAKEEVAIFSAMVFVFAALSGFVFIGFKSIQGRFKMNIKDVLAGIVLGVPNYFSIYFLIKALQNEGLSSAAIFTINNVAVVMLCTLLGILIFKERLSLKNWGGIALAVLSIILVALF